MTDLNMKTVPVIREAGHGEETGYLFSFGAYGDTHVAVIGGSLEDGLESCLDWLDDNAPGLLHTITAEDYANAARELGLDWPSEDEEVIGKVTQEAECDMTMVGHTTLENGNCIPSWEWHARELDASELATLMRRFCQNCESEIATEKECILCGECHTGLVNDVTHDLLIERGPVQPEPSAEEIAERDDVDNADDPDATDVRLQVRTWRGNDWAIRTGDSSYDQDHRGFWGAGRISPYDRDHCIGETALDLVNQALEHAATSEES